MRQVWRFPYVTEQGISAAKQGNLEKLTPANENRRLPGPVAAWQDTAAATEFDRVLIKYSVGSDPLNRLPNSEGERKLRYGLKEAFDYVVGEKLRTSQKPPPAPEFARELPRFVSRVRQMLTATELGTS